MKMNKKLIVATAACAALLVGSISTSLAWLIDKTPDVKNTFTYSNIGVTLEESVDADKDGQASFQMVPGHTIAKDPKVTLATDSVPCFVFVKVVPSDNYNTYFTYSIDNETWTQLVGVDNVYYAKVTDPSNWSKYVLTGAEHVRDCANTNDMDTCSCGDTYKNGCVTVNTTVTKELMAAIKENNQPTLTITAYASQLMKNNYDEFTPAEAWANANPTSSNDETGEGSNVGEEDN